MKILILSLLSLVSLSSMANTCHLEKVLIFPGIGVKDPDTNHQQKLETRSWAECYEAAKTLAEKFDSREDNHVFFDDRDLGVRKSYIGIYWYYSGPKIKVKDKLVDTAGVVNRYTSMFDRGNQYVGPAAFDVVGKILVRSY